MQSPEVGTPRKKAPAETPATRIIFTAKQRASLEAFTLPDPGDHQVRLRTLCSLISTGTESIVFNRLFEPGTHWDKWVKYPFTPGYALAAQVEAVGSKVQGLAESDRVVARLPHASGHVVDADKYIAVPTGVEPPSSLWFALAKIAFVGTRAAGYVLGDSVLIIGAGPIGQMALRWAVAAGCQSILVCDSAAQRLQLAVAEGTTATLSQPVDRALDAVLAANHGEKPRVVIDSTGNAQVFAAALALAADRGRVVLLGDTGTPAQQHLTPDVITRGLSIVGAHDLHNDHGWTDARVASLFFCLVTAGRFSLAGLNSHTFTPDHAQQAYEFITEHRAQTMGVVFDWAQPDPRALHSDASVTTAAPARTAMCG